VDLHIPVTLDAKVVTVLCENALCVRMRVREPLMQSMLPGAQVKELMNMGYDYAGRVDAAGRLDPHFGIAARQGHQPQQVYQGQPAAAAA
jgi:hypothetical protein